MSYKLREKLQNTLGLKDTYSFEDNLTEEEIIEIEEESDYEAASAIAEDSNDQEAELDDTFTETAAVVDLMDSTGKIKAESEEESEEEEEESIPSTEAIQNYFSSIEMHVTPEEVSSIESMDQDPVDSIIQVSNEGFLDTIKRDFTVLSSDFKRSVSMYTKNNASLYKQAVELKGSIAALPADYSKPKSVKIPGSLIHNKTDKVNSSSSEVVSVIKSHISLSAQLNKDMIGLLDKSTNVLGELSRHLKSNSATPFSTKPIDELTTAVKDIVTSGKTVKKKNTDVTYDSRFTGSKVLAVSTSNKGVNTGVGANKSITKVFSPIHLSLQSVKVESGINKDVTMSKKDLMNMVDALIEKITKEDEFYKTRGKALGHIKFTADKAKEQNIGRDAALISLFGNAGRVFSGISQIAVARPAMIIGKEVYHVSGSLYRYEHTVSNDIYKYIKRFVS